MKSLKRNMLNKSHHHLAVECVLCGMDPYAVTCAETHLTFSSLQSTTRHNGPYSRQEQPVFYPFQFFLRGIKRYLEVYKYYCEVFLFPQTGSSEWTETASEHFLLSCVTVDKLNDLFSQPYCLRQLKALMFWLRLQ